MFVSGRPWVWGPLGEPHTEGGNYLVNVRIGLVIFWLTLDRNTS